MNKIRFCDANTGDLLRSINDPTLPCIEVLRAVKGHDTIIYSYDDTIYTANDRHFYWTLEMELVSSGNDFSTAQQKANHKTRDELRAKIQTLHKDILSDC
jgi:hypothetical protein